MGEHEEAEERGERDEEGGGEGEEGIQDNWHDGESRNRQFGCSKTHSPIACIFTRTNHALCVGCLTARA
eukprot:481122-Pyramimonas_sp.AAC.1